MSLTFIGKTALITGGGNGIGRACAVKLASLGARLALVDINPRETMVTAEMCQAHSPDAIEPIRVEADLRKASEIERVAEEAMSRLLSLDVLINNVGIARATRLKDEKLLKDFDDIFALNVRSPLLMTKALSKPLITSKGCVINVSSIASFKAVPQMLPYAMSKAAVTSMTRSLAVDFGKHGVRVNEVNPGPILTGIMDSDREAFSHDAERAFLEFISQLNAIKRTPEVEDVANAVAFLASDQARNITGLSLRVDCGQQL